MKFTEQFWISKENHVLMNDKFSAAQVKQVYSVLEDFEGLESHLFLPTSGSTGLGLKLVAIAKDSILASAESVNLHLAVSAKDIFYVSIPWFHVGGLGIYARAFCAGAKLVEPSIKKWDPMGFQSEVMNQKITILSLVPTQIFDLVKTGLTCPSSIRVIVVGGGALSEDLYINARQLGYPLLPSYGMTETASQIATAELHSLSSLNLPLPKKLSHIHWQALPDNGFRIRGSSLLTGYLVQKNGKTVLEDPKEDGWFKPDDRVEIIGDCIRVIGRDSDFIRVGSETVILSDLNKSLANILQEKNLETERFIIVNLVDERKGSSLALVTDLKDFRNEDFKQISTQLAKIRAPFEIPQSYVYLPQIPRSELGKILWAELRSLLART